MTIYAATTNSGKLAEFATCASGSGVLVLALPGMAGIAEPVEDAATFMGNAELKARAYSLAVAETLGPGLLVFADDSGLEVDALGGAPGVRSARYAEDFAALASHLSDDEAVAKMGHPAEDAAAVFPTSEKRDVGHPAFPALLFSALSKDERNNALLLHNLRDVPEDARGARFVCALALARDGEVLLRAEGEVRGEILRAARGDGGFGYDPLFLLPSLGLTTAELAPAQKWEHSHRGNAFRGLLTQLHGIAQTQR